MPISVKRDSGCRRTSGRDAERSRDSLGARAPPGNSSAQKIVRVEALPRNAMGKVQKVAAGSL